MVSLSITSTIDPGLFRIALRIYFISALFLLGTIGRQCCKLATKVDLLQGHTVSINRMTGWLQARDVAIVLWKLRRLPGGVWLGFMMIITSLLTLTSDLAVTGLVKPVSLPDLCPFTEGLVLDWGTNVETFSAPPPNGYPALIAANVQAYSGQWNSTLPYRYECLVGIYRKVPWDGDPSFCGNEQDVLGAWECTDMNKDYNFSPGQSPSEINDWLYTNGLQYYPNSSWIDYGNGWGNTAHLAIWSSSALSDATLEPFDVMVSVDLYGNETGLKTMKTYQCQVTGEVDSINRILSQMKSVTTLNQWVDGLEGILYMGANTNISTLAQANLERYLNSMTMVQGGSNTILSSYTVDGDHRYYGCVTEMTTLSAAIIALVVFAGLILLITTAYWFFLLWSLGKHSLFKRIRGDSSRKNIKPVPDSTLSWILQAAREASMSTGAGYTYGDGSIYLGVPRRETELRGWSFSITDSVNGVARLVRRRGDTAPLMYENAFVNYEYKH
ncbi:hypothetical protein L207DRAFT_518878 [Hyaloscypha variabilis F]|uniref:Uncharacterized protein n=1 Tax=Hyaloscypha variabilis (strain UAMH 11265 / GT02V1 / F) TaxID=1149755 RepID=A0A2J6R0E5_HYAVF|nr:hypothetical protein L207DRAFT_518878 [Hyaloscypha variabilis F]